MLTQFQRLQFMLEWPHCFWVMLKTVHYGRRMYPSFWQLGRRGRWVKARGKIEPSKAYTE